MSKVPTARLQQLAKLQSWVFDKPLNPENKRIGMNVLRKSLRGPQITDYYYPTLKQLPTPKKLNQLFGDWNSVDPDEVYRLSRVEYLKRKGKGAPKKLKEKKVVEKRRK